jgi:hypothetical protein
MEAEPPAVAGPRVPVSLARDEAEALHYCQHLLGVLRVVLAQVQAVGRDALAVTVSTAIRAQQRRDQGRNRSSDAVAQAMTANNHASMEDVAGARGIAAKADAAAKCARMQTECDRLQAMQVAAKGLRGGGVS